MSKRTDKRQMAYTAAATDSALYAAKRGGRDRAALQDQAPASTSPLKNSMSAL